MLICLIPAQEEKRRQLLAKARADKARKRAESSQRKSAQRQRRERERAVMKTAREKQDKLTRQRETEVQGHVTERDRGTWSCDRERQRYRVM